MGTSSRTLNRLAPFLESPTVFVSTCAWSWSSIGTQRRHEGARIESRTASRNHRQEFDCVSGSAWSDALVSLMRLGGKGDPIDVTRK